MKKNTKKLLSLLLCAVLAFGAVLPAFAAEQTEVEPTWQDSIASVAPVGDEPWLMLELTPAGYIFTNYSIPGEYEVSFKDGSTARARIPQKQKRDLFYDGNYIGDRFDVDADGEAITLYACISFDEETKQSVFEIGQVVFAPVEYEGETYDAPWYFPISDQPCRTEIDDSSFLARILYPVFSFFQRILSFFTETRYKLSQR